MDPRLEKFIVLHDEDFSHSLTIPEGGGSLWASVRGVTKEGKWVTVRATQVFNQIAVVTGFVVFEAVYAGQNSIGALFKFAAGSKPEVKEPVKVEIIPD